MISLLINEIPFWKCYVIEKIHVSNFPVFVWRETAERRWSRVPGMAKPTSLTTIVQSCASSSTRMLTPSAQVRIPHSHDANQSLCHLKKIIFLIMMAVWDNVFMYILFFLKQMHKGWQWFQPSCYTSRWHCLASFLFSNFRLGFKYSVFVAANVTCSVTDLFICFSCASVFVLVVIILYGSKLPSLFGAYSSATQRYNSWWLSMCSLEFTSCFGL